MKSTAEDVKYTAIERLVSYCTRKRSFKSTILVLFLSTGVAVLVGCDPQTPNNPSVSSGTDADKAVQKTANDFVNDLSSSNFAEASKLTADTFADRTPDGLEKASKSTMWAFVGASHLVQDPIQYQKQGKQALVRMAFTGKDKVLYRTNLVLLQSKDGWLVSSILTPVGHPAMQKSGQQGASAAQH